LQVGLLRLGIGDELREIARREIRARDEHQRHLAMSATGAKSVAAL